jgi:long-chain fatty acid transport protein
MKRILTTAAALAAAATTAQAGGVERSTQSVAILFEQGRYAELSFGNFSPDVSGTAFGRSSGDMSSTYNTFSLGYKMDIGDRMALAVIIDGCNELCPGRHDGRPRVPRPDRTSPLQA